jgi:hypothetical protein
MKYVLLGIVVLGMLLALASCTPEEEARAKLLSEKSDTVAQSQAFDVDKQE